MSWFSELTSKAEAMLVKLDQDAASVLKKERSYDNQDLEDSFEQAPLTDVVHNEVPQEQLPVIPTSVISDKPVTRGDSAIVSQIEIQKDNAYRNSDKTSDIDDESRFDHSDVGEKSASASSEATSTNEQRTSMTKANNLVVGAKQDKRISKTTRFAMQTSVKRDRLFIASNKNNRSQSTRSDKESEFEDNLDARGIKASINQSLREYVSKASSRLPCIDSDFNTSNAHNSFFDDQPDIVTQPQSFSLEMDSIHDKYNNGFSTHGESVALKLLRQSASKNRSKFYLPKFLNRLARSNGSINYLFGNEMRISLRRARMRATSYLRRFDYYFQTYPMMKYVICSYLIFIQLLIVYVLFFYQSSSVSDLASKVSQEESVMKDSNLEVHPNRQIEPI